MMARPYQSNTLFKENVLITPYNLNDVVGDTVWLNINIPNKKIFDQTTNTRVFFDSASFSVIAQVDLLFNNPFIGTGPFASFIFPQGISVNTGNGGAQTYANISFGCSPSTDYNLMVGIVLIEKGVFGISFFNTAIRKCLINNYENSVLTFAFDVTDTHKQYYQQLPFSSIGKQIDTNILDRLDKKSMVIINVQ